jgi:hypothetical protein
MAPSSENVSVLAAPMATAAGVRRSAQANASSLCGIVTLAPRKPEPWSARTVSDSSAGGTGSFT